MSSKPSIAAAAAKTSNASADRVALEKIAAIATEKTGVQLGERQMTMVESRVIKRVRELGLASFTDYLGYVKRNEATESLKIVSLLTTHHTFFFREFAHFEHLAEKALPSAVEAARAQGRKRLRIWSAACSRGQEAYSIAMWLESHLPRIAPDFDYEIIGTDVDPESVASAKNGVYRFEDLKEVPLALMDGHWARGTGEIKDFVKARDSLRKRCRFEVGNLMQIDANARDKFDFIFCRNVFIYFKPDQVLKIAKDLISRLENNGFLYVGISESLHGLPVNARTQGPSIYQKGLAEAPRPAAAAAPSRPTPTPEPVRPIRVFNVDDSPVILKLLAQIFSKDSGFEVVGQAINGIDAAKKLKDAGQVDVMTLDIHMPEQDGISYLREHMSKPGHPPVVMVTSVSRESSGLALEALGLGASDFVEKPALSNLTQRSEEIRTKLKWVAKAKVRAVSLDLDRSINTQAAERIPDPRSKLRAFFSGGLESLPRAIACAQSSKGSDQPPMIFVFDGAQSAMPALRSEFDRKLGLTTLDAATMSQPGFVGLKPGEVALVEWDEAVSLLGSPFAKRLRVSAMVFGEVSHDRAKSLSSALSALDSRLFLEDVGDGRGTASLQSLAADVAPCTSFTYFSAVHLCERKSSN